MIVWRSLFRFGQKPRACFSCNLRLLYHALYRGLFRYVIPWCPSISFSLSVFPYVILCFFLLFLCYSFVFFLLSPSLMLFFIFIILSPSLMLFFVFIILSLSLLLFFVSSFYSYVNLCFFPSLTFSYVILWFNHSITFSFCLSLCYSLFLPFILMLFFVFSFYHLLLCYSLFL